jgi:hypothetical protein
MPVYVQHEVIGKVLDVFNAEALWQAPGLALFARKPLLRDLLERSPRELRGRAPVRCFSHITLLLPQDDVDDDRHLTRGARVRDLAQSLTALHQKDFGDLLGGDDVRYDVVGTDTLQPGQVEVKFGHAVYLPAPDEKILYNISASVDGTHWQAVCPIYPGQRLALIGNDGGTASHTVPAWPFGSDGAILLINDGPDAPIELQSRPKEAFACSFDPLAGCYTIRPKRGGDEGTRLLLKVARVGAQARPAAVWKAREPELTALPAGHRIENDATYAPVARQRISLAALALPRLSRYRDTGARALEFGIDAALRIAAEGKEAVLRLGVDAGDELYAINAEGRQPVTAPAVFQPVEGSALRLLAMAPPMAERYCALLELPPGMGIPVAGAARHVFGRSHASLGHLRVLDSARFLQLAAGTEAASADRIGLSRNAFAFEASASGYAITRLSPTQALFHLDPQLRFVAAIVDADKPYLLPPGHHLVAGHYVLRFDA